MRSTIFCLCIKIYFTCKRARWVQGFFGSLDSIFFSKFVYSNWSSQKMNNFTTSTITNAHSDTKCQNYTTHTSLHAYTMASMNSLQHNINITISKSKPQIMVFIEVFANHVHTRADQHMMHIKLIMLSYWAQYYIVSSFHMQQLIFISKLFHLAIPSCYLMFN